jgi:uncharacterized membrane protein YsdA (DUF1294 family)
MFGWIQIIFGIQMYHEEMQVKFEYGCNPIIIEGVIALGPRKLLENEFPFIFALMVKWIQMIFGIQMYHKEMKVKFDYGCCPIIIGEVIALRLRKLLQNDSFR